MPILDLSIDTLLTTTRSVRKRLDLSRPVEPEVIDECLELALQAPTASNSQSWHFVVVTDPHQRQALATIYRKGAERYRELMTPVYQKRAAASEQEARTVAGLLDSGQYLIDHLHEVPVHVIPCIQGRTDHLPIVAQSGTWGSIMPAAWSFMLAARSRGLGTSLTSFHLFFEQEAAEVLGIPYEEVMQAALIPVAYTLGTDFKPAARKPLESVLHRDRW
ncbi:MAG: nitroreductase family protein [Chloroflexi bacterium]|nr:MAG: nitroreductase family protein [Chloroflexota bacterium]